MGLELNQSYYFTMIPTHLKLFQESPTDGVLSFYFENESSYSKYI